MTQIFKCRSCLHGFSDGRGVRGNRFCSERCMDYFDAGNNLPSAGLKGHGEHRVVASGYPAEIGKPLTLYSKRPAFTGFELIDVLSVPTSSLGVNGFIGRFGSIRYRSPARWEIVVPAEDRKAIRDLDCVTLAERQLWLTRLPNEAEAGVIRTLTGLRKSPSWDTQRSLAPQSDLDNENGQKNVQEVPAAQGVANVFTPLSGTTPLAGV